MRIPLIMALLALLVLPLLAQEKPRKKKPVLIRPDRTREQVEEGPPEPDPERARKNLEVGNFYFKRGNYRAAEERFREAVLYGPQWPEAYERLIDALEKQQLYGPALEVCARFVEANPDASEVEHFQKRSKNLEKKQSRERR